MKAWKVQKFFGDVAYDLRSRGLLPVVALLAVAMVAVPVLISRGSSKKSTAPVVATANTGQTASENDRAVVSYSPAGIRNYKRRLSGLSPKDPFRQQFSHSAATASALNSTVSTGGGTTVSSSTASTSPTTVGGSTGSGGKKKHKKKKSTTTQTVSYQVNVLAGDATATLTPFNNVASMTLLPSQATPVVVYYALSSDSTHALFLVSNKVATLTGPGTCVPAPDDCALLSLAAGQSEDLLYTGDGKTYRIVIADIKRVSG